MRRVEQEELNKLIKLHKIWLDSNGKQGDRLVLINCNLRGSNLSMSDLKGSDLSMSDLKGSNLRGSNLSMSDLRVSDLRESNLSESNLRGSNLRGSNLSMSDLKGSNLSESDLRGSNLRGSDLSGSKITNTILCMQCQERGSFTAFKKLKNDLIAELEIPADAKRSSATSRKCRCDKAKVISITDENGNEYKEGVSKHNPGFVYRVGEVVSVDNFDEDRWNECSTGIHFFITRQEAVEY